jgi:diaminohydroxyphosphoribosylaminopyrimidine deaminase/5-amino-6-(5-phosphoribosylamino)uracil reductase
VPDPNPRVAGGGLTRLAAAGICCEGGLLEGEARALNRGFLQRFTAGRPRVTVKLGMSLDARVALADGRSQWITGAAARADVQRLRALSGAIMTGSGTLLADDPRLDVRDPRFDIAGRPPVRVVLDRLLRTPPTARLFDTAGAVAIFTARPDLPAAPVLRARGAQLESVALRDDGRGLSLPAVLRRLAELEINDVLVEAGPTLVAALLADGLVDELVLYVAPILLGAAAQPAFALAEPPTLAAAPGFDVVETVCLGSDQRLVLRRP